MSGTRNDGKAFEALTEQVFTRLLRQTNLCAEVERDVVLEGKSTKHQIDVTFEFVAGPTPYRTIVQCKDWASPVKQEQILAFQSVLLDIPGQPRGIIVSRSGFQEGARHVAEHHGIQLYELRSPCDEDWNGLIRTVVTEMHVRAPQFDNVRLIPNEAVVRQDMAARGLLNLDVRFGGPPPRMMFESGAPCDLNRILNGLLPETGSGPFHVRYEFAEQRAFAEFPDCPLPRVAILAIEADITVTELDQEMRMNIDHLIAYCFRDVLGGSVRFLSADGGVVRQP
jgi:hypothetical protein